MDCVSLVQSGAVANAGSLGGSDVKGIADEDSADFQTDRTSSHFHCYSGLTEAVDRCLAADRRNSHFLRPRTASAVDHLVDSTSSRVPRIAESADVAAAGADSDSDYLAEITNPHSRNPTPCSPR